MSIVGDVFGAGSAFDFASKVVDKIWPDKGDAEKAKLALAEMQHSGELKRLELEAGLVQGQIEVNKAEAASGSIYIAGWRPFVGWVCGAGFAWEYPLRGVADWIARLAGYGGTFPDLRGADLIPLLIALLGFGAYRTREKLKGVSKE